MNYPYDEDSKLHKGFAFVLLTRQSDVKYCLGRSYRNDWWLQGAANAPGFDANGRAYVSLRSARLEEPRKNEEETHLVFAPNKSIGLRDFKAWVEELLEEMKIPVVACEAEYAGAHKHVHVHTKDGETAAVVKMFCHQFTENQVSLNVHYARTPKAPKPVVEVKEQPAITKKAEPKLVLEPITENYGKFGVPYAEAVKSSSSASSSKSVQPAQPSNAGKSKSRSGKKGPTVSGTA